MVKHYNAKGAHKIWMQSQARAQKFYETCGFKPVSDPHGLYGLDHVGMELT